ncbi:MAG: NAD(P)H-dependent oxidoreductase [Patescibacteria group bacterium]|nr:NAD(P)H-dependent oxidoreductase [Patescibacteria group bacterium]
MVDEIKKIKKNSNDVIDIIDLYKTNLKQDFLKYEDKKEIKKENITNSVTLEIQEKISWADELIFIFPIWWGDMPAIMKNFFESNF